MRKLLWLIVLICAVLLNASSFVAANYVADEFDLPRDFFDDPSFVTFAKKHKKAFMAMYDRAQASKGYLIRLIRETLLREDMSDLFLYMSIVESNLRTEALSSKSAKGIWQFREQTAKRYALQCDADIDERSDPYLSTRAAIRYLNDLHSAFGKWYLAVMAYNCGEGRLRRAIHRAQSDDVAVLIDDTKKLLPKETRDYLRSVVLLALVVESRYIAVHPIDESLNDPSVVCPRTDNLSARTIRRNEDLETFARRIGISIKCLRCFNPTLSKGTLPRLLLVPADLDVCKGTVQAEVK